VERNISGELKGEHIIIKDKKSGSRLYNRGLFGTPLSGGGLQLELIEGFYLLDSEKIRVFKSGIELNLKDFLTYITKLEPTFEIKYIVYRDLRQRGHIVKPSNVTDFVIHDTKNESGAGAQRRPIKYWSIAISERAKFKIAELSDLILTANQTRKNILIGVVDEEGDLTYYKGSISKPKSKKKSDEKNTTQNGSAVLIEDRVMLWEPDLISALRSNGFYGKEIGKSLQLALTESIYLMDKGILEIRLAKTGRKLSAERFLRIAKKIQPDFNRRLTVYRHLKGRDLIVKTGFKYGTHFRVYEGDPNSDHSEYLVHGVPNNYECSWEEISRAVRLAQGVRKQMLFARVTNDENEVQYINIERIKP
jgi:tRNA-intron endonuclease